MKRGPGHDLARAATGDGKPTTDGTSVPSVSRTAHTEAYLRDLIAGCVEPVHLLDALEPEQLGTPVGTASIARAALRYLLDGTPEAISARLREELAAADLVARWRVRMAGHDVRGDTDWARVFDVVTARREYRERWQQVAS